MFWPRLDKAWCGVQPFWGMEHPRFIDGRGQKELQKSEHSQKFPK